jgi:hypothetical protein
VRLGEFESEGEKGSYTCGLFQQRDGPLVISARGIQSTQIEACAFVFGIDAQDFFKLSDRLSAAISARQQHAEIGQGTH